MLAFVLVVASAFLHAGWNALVRRSPDPAAAVHVVVAIAGAATAIVGAVDLAIGAHGLPAASIGLGAIAGVLEAGYFRALGRALAIAPLPPVYTVSRGGAAVLVWPVSMLALGERANGPAAAGAVLVVLGLVISSGLVGGGAARASADASADPAGVPAADASTAPAAARHAPPRALAYAAECAVYITAYNFAYKLALADGASPGAVFALSMVVATAIGAIAGGAAYRTSFAALVRARPRMTIGAGVVCATAFLLYMFALAGGGAAYVFTLRNTSVLFAVLLGWAIGDRPSRAQVAGAAVVVGGAVLLGVGH